MRGKSGTSLNQQKRPLARCRNCNGNGTVRPMFHELPCPICHASGVVCAETHKGLPLEDLVLQLRIRLNDRDREVTELRRQLLDRRQSENGRGYGAGGSRYHGD